MKSGWSSQEEGEGAVYNQIKKYRETSFKVQSRYLENELKEKEFGSGKRNEVDPRDIQGRRLSEFWG